MPLPQSLFRYDVAFLSRGVELLKENRIKKRMDSVKSAFRECAFQNRFPGFTKSWLFTSIAVETTASHSWGSIYLEMSPYFEIPLTSELKASVFWEENAYFVFLSHALSCWADLLFDVACETWWWSLIQLVWTDARYGKENDLAQLMFLKQDPGQTVRRSWHGCQAATSPSWVS